MGMRMAGQCLVHGAALYARRGLMARAGNQARKQFFFEKKNQKTFASRSTPDESPRGSPDVGRAVKSFLVLFFKKELLPFPCLPQLALTRRFAHQAPDQRP
jgi:hypothetical protein